MTGGTGPARSRRARLRRGARPPSGSSAGGRGCSGIALDGRNARRFVNSIGRASYSRADVDRIIADRYGMAMDVFVRCLRSIRTVPGRIGNDSGRGGSI